MGVKTEKKTQMLVVKDMCSRNDLEHCSRNAGQQKQLKNAPRGVHAGKK